MADATPQKIHDALWKNGLCGEGYKFAMVFDESKDEYEEPPKETELYFLDVVNMLNHAPTAYDVDKVVDMLEDFKDMELIDGTPAHGINEYKRICKCIEIVKSGAKQCGVYTKLRSVRKGNLGGK